MVEDQAAKAASGDVTLLDTLNLTASVPNRSVADYCALYGGLLDVRRFAGTFLEGWSSTMVDSHVMRHNTNIGASDHRWSSLREWCACPMSPFWLINMPFTRHGYKVFFVRRLYALFRSYREMAIGKEGVDQFSLCCLVSPYDKLYIIEDAAECWRELHFECRHCITVTGRIFVGWHSIELIC